ncbi:mobilization protein [Ligilactobacillus acidipiscis]|uniref:Mobilization protein n=2 Tax=Ligilactobacillus acidipiscis TaxID=89059 RepID=A0A0R2K386_9LACO|nr:mobilization protein [Ligilactobacillus acidipiscis]
MDTKGAIKMYSEKQEKQIHIRVSNSDYEKIKKSAELYGISMGQYAKQIVLKKRLKQPKFAYPEAKKLRTELNYIGNNINQFARSLNQITKYASENSSQDVSILAEKIIQEAKEALMSFQKEVNRLWQQLK